MNRVYSSQYVVGTFPACMDVAWCVSVSVCRFFHRRGTAQNYELPFHWHQWRRARLYWKHRCLCPSGELHDTRRYGPLSSCFCEYPLNVSPFQIFISAVCPCFRLESYPKGPCEHGESASVWLGSWGIYGLWLSAQRWDPHTPQWTGCGEGHIQVKHAWKGKFTDWLMFCFSL